MFYVLLLCSHSLLGRKCSSLLRLQEREKREESGEKGYERREERVERRVKRDVKRSTMGTRDVSSIQCSADA